MKKYAIALAAMVFAFPVSAQFLDGNHLYNQCLNNRSGALGYVIGVSDTMWSATPAWGQCMPFNVTSGQITDLSCQAISANPQLRHLPASEIVVYAIGETFGC